MVGAKIIISTDLGNNLISTIIKVNFHYSTAEMAGCEGEAILSGPTET